MLKKLALPITILVLSSGLALAEGAMTKEPSSGRSAATSTSSLSTSRWLASDIYKADVYDASNHKIGDVTDLVLDGDGSVMRTVIGVGGFLGVGQKNVAIPFKEVKISMRDGKDRIVVDRTKEDLMSAPAYTRPEQSGRSVAPPASSLSTPNWAASDIYKADVYDNSEHKIGEVTDLVLDRDGAIPTAVISVGGFLGVGQKDVAVPFKDLKMASRDGKDWLAIDRTKDQLKNAPAYDKRAELNKM